MSRRYKPGCDLTGMRFGALTVTAEHGERTGTQGRVWVCLCECGVTILSPAQTLKSGSRQSCGCLRKQRYRETVKARLAARFWRRVQKGDSCWLWLGARDRGGYGLVSVDRKRMPATHLAWFLAHGSFPLNGLIACHKCDNPPCIRADHLFLGTQADNAADMKAKGRSATGERNGANTRPDRRSKGDEHYLRRYPERILRGERHGNSKLTDEQAQAIADSPDASKVLAARYAVSVATIERIRNGTIWRHLNRQKARV